MQTIMAPFGNKNRMGPHIEYPTWRTGGVDRQKQFFIKKRNRLF